MYLGNICRFIPPKKDADTIHTFHFVLEREADPDRRMHIRADYRLYLVMAGEGTLHTEAGPRPLTAGDVFLTIPSRAYRIESGPGLQYAYISFLGAKANRIMDELLLGRVEQVFHGYAGLEPIWRQGLAFDETVSGLSSEGVLLYTFAAIGARQHKFHIPPTGNTPAAAVRQYIDDHFADERLSLEKICREFSYSTRYISAVFKRTYQTGISAYLRTVRIRHACSLMEQGLTCVRDIAAACGFADPLYFSKVFKAQTGHSPHEHIRALSRPPVSPEDKAKDTGCETYRYMVK